MTRITYRSGKITSLKKQASGMKHRKTLKTLRVRIDKALEYKYRDRKVIKRLMRSRWIVTINNASRIYGISYSRLQHNLYSQNIVLNRKILADIALHEPDSFRSLCLIASGIDMNKT